jgi:hypothetical protein
MTSAFPGLVPPIGLSSQAVEHTINCKEDLMAKRNDMQPVTLDDLISGRRARVTTAERARLTGKSVATYQRRRWLGTDIKYQRDTVGTIWYSATDVLAELDQPSYQSTSEYDTTAQTQKLAKARAALSGTKSGAPGDTKNE